MSSSDGGREDNGGDITSSKKECTSCEQNDVATITEDFNSVAIRDHAKKGKDDSGDDSFECSLCSWGQTTKICITCEQKLEQAKNDDNDISQNDTEDIDRAAVRDDVSVCASCGKEGSSSDMNTCNKCKSVKYCNAACKKKHRKKHKKACEKRVAELHEKALFKEVEPEECPICLLSLSGAEMTERFQTCCGKTICSGCTHAMKISEGKDICPFCRAPHNISDEEEMKRTRKLIDNGNAEAYYLLGCRYQNGTMGMPQDRQKSNELWLKAGELGCATAYFNLGCFYSLGDSVEADKKKSEYYWELAAMAGSVTARYNLGCMELRAGNLQRAMKHLMIAVRAGDKESLDYVKKGFMMGLVTKDEYEMTLRAYHDRQKELKSDARDKAAAYYAEMFSEHDE